MKKYSRIRLVGCDLDGTLLNSKGEISERNRKAIERLMKSGVEFAAVTGRPLMGLPAQLTAIPAFRYCVLSNGAFVYDIREQKVIAQQFFSEDCVDRIIKMAKRYHAAYAFIAEGRLYIPDTSMAAIKEKYEHNPVYIWKATKDIEHIIESKRKCIEKFNFDFLDQDSYEECVSALRNIPEVEISCNMPEYLELTVSGCNKGSGLDHLMTHLAIDNSEVMVIGDSDNDRSMYVEGRMRVAMQNAEQGIQDVADFISLDHDEEGVAYALDTLLFTEQSTLTDEVRQPDRA